MQSRMPQVRPLLAQQQQAEEGSGICVKLHIMRTPTSCRAWSGRAGREPAHKKVMGSMRRRTCGKKATEATVGYQLPLACNCLQSRNESHLHPVAVGGHHILVHCCKERLQEWSEQA